ncbi:pPIWI_RE module domain-containing protein [Kitasatospora aureofaciens]|uniref:pPIWI_RE module domain-containing protein n=1 Tax=Kitasatospora aureofaciens TaxID=1894 RepID=UPI0037C987DC
MPPLYRNARTTAWVPATPDASFAAPYRVMPFPERWRDAVLELCNAAVVAAGREPWRTVPTRRLEQVLQAFAPDVLVLPRPYGDRGQGETDPWLCVPAGVPDPLPPEVLDTLVAHWLRDLRPEREYRGLLKDTLAELAAHPPRWETLTQELLPQETTAGGTARPASVQFALSPDWLARQVLTLGSYPYRSGHLTFRAMPRGARDQGAQLVSQPLCHPGEGGRPDAWWSVVLSITLQTTPFDPLPRFHLHWSVRRWATRVGAKTGRLRLPWASATTVLLRPRVPFLPGTPRSERFAVARLERYRAENGDFGDRWKDGGPARMLTGLPLGEPFPDADGILTDPVSWLRDDMRAAVLYRTAMGSHDVGAGFMTQQLSQLTAWAEQALPSGLRRAPDLTLLDRGTPLNAPRTNGPRDGKQAEEEAQRARRRLSCAYALDAMPDTERQGGVPVLEARLLWQSSRLRDAALASLVEHLGLKGDGGSYTAAQYEAATPGEPVIHEWSAPELTVRVRCLRPLVVTGERTAESLVAPLDLPKGSRSRNTDVAAAVDMRRRRTAEWLAADWTSAAPALALVEIGRPESFGDKLCDPKFALRLGCAQAGYVTQFTTVPVEAGGPDGKGGRAETDTSLGHRTRNAWDDGLRQLGARTVPLGEIGEGLPEGLRYAALWMVRKNRTTRNRWAAYVPVGVLITPDPAGTGAARVEGWDPDAHGGAGAWVPYPLMLTRLTRRAEIEPLLPGPRQATDAQEAESPAEQEATGRPSPWQNREQQRREAAEWLHQLRSSLRAQPTVLFAEAHNARQHWTWLQDGRVERDRIQDGLAPARHLDPDLRLVRVRAGARGETPQWWGLAKGGKPNGIQQGVWQPDEAPDGARVFNSTTAKPVTAKHAAVTADKLSTRPILQGKRKGEPTVDTDQNAWLPGLLEIVVLGCHEEDGDDPRAFALLTHLLRQSPDYTQATALPLPLHLAGLAQEYVLPTPKSGDAADEGGAAGEAWTGSGSSAEPAADPDPEDQPLPDLEEPDGSEVEGDGQLSLFEV